MVEEFSKLTQTGSIDEYLEKFEALKSLMQIRNPCYLQITLLIVF